jgi:LysM repeat protein
LQIMGEKPFHLVNSLQTRINTACNNANGNPFLLQSTFRTEMSSFAQKLPILLPLDFVTKYEAMPMHVGYQFQYVNESSPIIKYTVKKGDTLWDISRKLTAGKVPAEQIRKLNGLKNDTIYPGQVLNIDRNTNYYAANVILSYEQLGEILHPSFSCLPDKTPIEQIYLSKSPHYSAVNKGSYHIENQKEGEWTEIPEMVNHGIEGAGTGLEKVKGSFRLTNGAYNGSEFSPKFYETGWEGGSVARITTYNIAEWGGRIGKGSIIISVGFGLYNINEANQLDGRSFGINTQVATAETAGGIALGWAGAETGAEIGAAIGVWFGGAGAIPGAIIGGIIGGIFGGWAGSRLGKESVLGLHR